MRPGMFFQQNKNRGQGITEYILIVAACVLVAFFPVPGFSEGTYEPLMVVVINKLGEFYQNILHVICLPIP